MNQTNASGTRQMANSSNQNSHPEKLWRPWHLFRCWHFLFTVQHRDKNNCHIEIRSLELWDPFPCRQGV